MAKILILAIFFLIILEYRKPSKAPKGVSKKFSNFLKHITFLLITASNVTENCMKIWTSVLKGIYRTFN